jgi:hypothetical protein
MKIIMQAVVDRNM